MVKSRVIQVFGLFLIVALLVVGCSKDSSSSKGGAERDSSEMLFDPSDPLSVYSEPVTVTAAVRAMGDIQPPYKGSAFEELYSSYGINVEVEWAIDAAQYDSKVNTVIASGDIPDVLYVVGSQPMTTLIKSGMTADIGPLLDYLSPDVAAFFKDGIGKDALDSVTYDGKVTLLPTNITELINNSFPLFIRKDWLDNLGLELPETMEDFKQVALAFTQNDPDGNGKDDTYGLALMGQTNLLMDWGGLYGFFGGYGVQPGVWYDGMIFYSEDENGEAIWDGTRPEVKEGLQLLQDLYKAKAIPADFPTVDGSRIMEDLNGGKAGMVFGVRGLPIWAINKTVLNNPNAEWYAMNMPTTDGVDFAPIFAFQPVNSAYAISTDAEHPEAIMKMINAADANDDPIFTHPSAGPGIVGTNDPYLEKNENLAFFAGYEAAKSGDLSVFDEYPYLVDRYEKVKGYEETKDPALWPFWNAFYPGPGHAWYLTFAENDESMIKKNLWWGLPTESMVRYLPLYKKMAEETMTRIITGNADVSAWDKMVSDWNKLGGDIITEEVRKRLE